MPYNPYADIQQYTWYRSTGGQVKYYLCVRARFTWGDCRPFDIEMLEYLTCTPKPIDCEKLAELLTKGSLVVAKSPFGE
ncbi:hypothetical protein [Mucilaginibacter sp.]|uniref:hypothetical protein n=1 Tax=Mucilaginibacter sp. TaxID=1882438 RepID=UPI00263653EE|nr:hypothetical protein [Mucilaginibacter sp.]MDB4919830.1 hypothetical protein [Mucilaginibacter sp.]